MIGLDVLYIGGIQYNYTVGKLRAQFNYEYDFTVSSCTYDDDNSNLMSICNNKVVTVHSYEYYHV